MLGGLVAHFLAGCQPFPDTEFGKGKYPVFLGNILRAVIVFPEGKAGAHQVAVVYKAALVILPHLAPVCRVVEKRAHLFRHINGPHSST